MSAAWRARLFVATICTGSFLLFLVQPMIARMALPRLGGAPAVWNSAMLVYQALLLGGYAYAHTLTRLRPRAQAGIHLALFLAAALMLPIGLSAAMPSATANPLVWVPWLLVSSIGPLFFVVAAQAPLMQRWFALSGHGDPYALYAASNLGSFGGLIAYPLLVEPFFPLASQSMLWTAGYVLLLLLVAGCALGLPRDAHVEAEQATGAPPSARTIAHWIVLAAVPSGLMLSTTTHLTTDVVAMPLLWVSPLGLYLLSFSIAFATRRGLADGISNVAPLVLLIAGGTAFANSSSMPTLFLPVGLALLFVVAVALHTRLYELRPEPARLTGFYLAMSAGGVLGGIFCALVAPLIFDWAYEHPILILAAAALVVQRPLFAIGERIGRAGLLAVAIIVVPVAALPGLGLFPVPAPTPVTFGVVLVLLACALIAVGHRWLFVLVLAGQMYALGAWSTLAATAQGVRERSYFGVYAVSKRGESERQLVHGTTVHGIQSLVPGRETHPLSYYAPKSGVGIALAAASPGARVGVVGLGAGTLACYAKPGQDWRFYEIDPLVAGIARDRSKFTFLSRCLPDVPVEIGDARIVLANEPAAGLDILVIDAFSSDAVPMHLLTREALRTYQRRLDRNGLLMMHISNRYLDLEPVLAAARRDGWHAIVRDYDASGEDRTLGYASSLWVALARDRSTVGALVKRETPWRDIRPRAGFAGWSDDHSSILPLIKWGKL